MKIRALLPVIKILSKQHSHNSTRLLGARGPVHGRLLGRFGGEEAGEAHLGQVRGQQVRLLAGHAPLLPLRIVLQQVARCQGEVVLNKCSCVQNFI